MHIKIAMNIINMGVQISEDIEIWIVWGPLYRTFSSCLA